jgi:hypothetical protein
MLCHRMYKKYLCKCVVPWDMLDICMYGLAWFGLARLGVAGFGWAWFGLAWPGFAQLGQLLKRRPVSTEAPNYCTHAQLV